jgi:serine/threonine-protein kinase
MIGELLNNRYTITARLGKGAMGTVYRATDTQSRREVAIKVISAELAVDAEALERFKREGEALSKLKHPNIVGFVDAFQNEEHYVIVMEYVSGGSLYELIKTGPLPIERACQIALDLCDALIRAHRLNIVHRDLKPENILIDEDGTPKLADFGVARLSEGTRMTRSGTQVGTPYYMSPEAWEGKTLDAQADIWSLGVVLFEMLAGQVPFGGDTGPAVMQKVFTTRAPDLRKLRAEAPPGLVKVIRHMLTREKKMRYQIMREVAVDLERVQKTIPPISAKAILTDPAARKSLPKTPRPLRMAGFTGIAVLLFGIGVWAVPKIIPLMQTLKASTTSSTLIETPTPAFQLVPTVVSDKDGMILLYVPAGEFMMGGNDGHADEKPQHTVYLDSFWIDKTEVTNAMYARCVQDAKCSRPEDTTHYDKSTYENHPVVYVSWDDAYAYCSWANRRLPTEAEWEKAARGIDKRSYPWGNVVPKPDLLNYDSKIGNTTEVGSYETGKSFYGAYDMAGNVWEWVNDWYQPAYYQISPSSNPQGSDAGSSLSKVLRGGSWVNTDDLVRSSSRLAIDPANASFSIGFRCSQSP